MNKINFSRKIINSLIGEKYKLLRTIEDFNGNRNPACTSIGEEVSCSLGRDNNASELACKTISHRKTSLTNIRAPPGNVGGVNRSREYRPSGCKL